MSDKPRVQYCRYCAFCTASVDCENVAWCSGKQKEMTHAQAKRVNHCKLFVFNEIDALNFDLDKTYKPRGFKSREKQPSLFGGMI